MSLQITVTAPAFAAASAAAAPASSAAPAVPATDDGEIDVATLKGKKVPLGPGRSAMHWLSLLRSWVRRPQKRYTLADVSTHTDPTRSVWMALRGKVYDVTPYLDYHPGGRHTLMMAAGKDATKMFGQ